jgi:hypothetical protein
MVCDKVKIKEFLRYRCKPKDNIKIEVREEVCENAKYINSPIIRFYKGSFWSAVINFFKIHERWGGGG